MEVKEYCSKSEAIAGAMIANDYPYLYGCFRAVSIACGRDKNYDSFTWFLMNGFKRGVKLRHETDNGRNTYVLTVEADALKDDLEIQ